MKNIFTFLVLIGLYGCVVATNNTGSQSHSSFDEDAVIMLASARLANVGMTKQEVESVMGKQVVTGYQLVQNETVQYQPITLANPYRSETVAKGKKNFLIDYFLVSVKKQDGQVTDDELFPLVYENDRLVGKGWDYYTKHIKN